MLAACGQLDARAVEGCAVVGELSLTGELRPIRGRARDRARARARTGCGADRLPRRAGARGGARRRASRCSASSTLHEAVDVLARRAPRRRRSPTGADPRRRAALEPPDLCRRPRPQRADAGARGRGGGRPQPLHARPARHRQDDARAAAPVDPAAAHRAPRRSRSRASTRSPGCTRGGGLVERAAVPRAAPHDLARPGWSAAARSRRRARRRSPTTACCSSTSCRSSRAPRSRRCASRSRTAASTIVRAQRRDAVPDALHARRGVEPVPVRAGRATRCRCTAADLARHQRRLSGPLLDRIDVTVAVGRPAAEALRDAARARPRRSLREQRHRRARAAAAPAAPALGLACNAQMTPRMCASSSAPTPSALRLLYELHDRHGLSARGHGRVLRVARTVADLDGSRRRRPRARHRRARAPHERPDRPRMTAEATSSRHRPHATAAACDACLRRTDLIAARRRLARRRVARAQGADRPRARAARRGAARPRRAARCARYAAFSAGCARRRDRRRRPARRLPLRARLPAPPARAARPAGRAARRRSRRGALPAGEAVAIVGAAPRDAVRARGRARARPRR